MFCVSFQVCLADVMLAEDMYCCIKSRHDLYIKPHEMRKKRPDLLLEFALHIFDLSVSDHVRTLSLLEKLYTTQMNIIPNVLSWLIHVDESYHEINRLSLLAACRWCAEYSWSKLRESTGRFVLLHGGSVLFWFQDSCLEPLFVHHILTSNIELPKEKHHQDICILLAQYLTKAGKLPETHQTGELLKQYRLYRNHMVVHNLFKPRLGTLKPEISGQEMIRHIELQMLASETSHCLARSRAQQIHDTILALPQSNLQQAPEMTLIITDMPIKAEHGVVWDLSRADNFEIIKKGVRGFSLCWLDMFRDAGFSPQSFTASGMHKILQQELQLW